MVAVVRVAVWMVAVWMVAVWMVAVWMVALWMERRNQLRTTSPGCPDHLRKRSSLPKPSTATRNAATCSKDSSWKGLIILRGHAWCSAYAVSLIFLGD
jgi:hypothetical protein